MGEVIFLSAIAGKLDAIMQEIIGDETCAYFDLATINTFTDLSYRLNHLGEDALSSEEVNFINQVFDDFKSIQ
jgi:hypothetical protein